MPSGPKETNLTWACLSLTSPIDAWSIGIEVRHELGIRRPGSLGDSALSDCVLRNPLIHFLHHYFHPVNEDNVVYQSS